MLRLGHADGREEIVPAGSDALIDADAKRFTRLPVGHPEGYIEAFANLYGDFATRVRGGDVWLPGIAEGLRSMAFVEAALASSAGGGGMDADRGDGTMIVPKGPAIFLAQYVGDAAPFDSLAGMARWAAGLGFAGIQVPSWEGALHRSRTRRREPRLLRRGEGRVRGSRRGDHRAVHASPGPTRRGAPGL